MIQAHLTETGLHESSRALREESGIGAAGVFHKNFGFWASGGQWHLVLESLNTLDRNRVHLDPDLQARVHEMAILELAESNEIELAYSLYRVVQRSLEASLSDVKIGGAQVSRGRVLEQKLASLVSSRQKDPSAPVKEDFYPYDKQEMRNELGEMLDAAIPRLPSQRLTTLIQQSVKWQTHTGQIPRIKQWWEDQNRKKRKKEFDLVLGTSKAKTGEASSKSEELLMDPLPTCAFAAVKFGKNATAEAAVFLPDGSGLVTGSSDGLIEIWDPTHDYSKLRLDLPYQQKEELLGHDASISALVVSRDGEMLVSAAGNTVSVWRLDTGRCLRSIKVTEGEKNSVTCLDVAPDSTHLLIGSQDGASREFGLHSAKLLKEFHGHTSYVSKCLYYVSPEYFQVITASGDGTVRIFDGVTSACLKLMRPVSSGLLKSSVGSSILIDSAAEISADSSSIHSIIPLHSPNGTFVICPRGPRIFLMNMGGIILRAFDSEKVGAIFVAAAASPSNRWLYAVQDDGVCCIFSIDTGKLAKSIMDFGSQSTYKSKESSVVSEITTLVHHPQKTIVAAFSNDKVQKKGMLVLWR